MPSGFAALCLLLLPTGALGFGIVPGDSLSHMDITEEAILNVTAQVCFNVAQAEGSHFTLEILTVGAVAEACSASGSTKTFSQAIKYIKRRNIGVDIRFPLTASYHLDSEELEEGRKIIAEGLQAIKASINQENYEAARQTLGEILHPLQDFYSHSNWVELGNTITNSNLLRFGTSIGNIADESRATCRDCDGSDCTDNILEDILAENILTSGYSATIQLPPEGKCLHGDIPGRTGILNPEGGINKDFLDSSHGHLHTEAANLAIDATKELLQDIRGAAGDKKFLLLVGISRGISSQALSFVIDTTESMLDEIEEVTTITSNVIKSEEETEDRHSRYILVTFNDPEIGPVTKTTDPEDFLNAIQSLQAAGGGDQAELSLSGLQLALTGAHSNSEIFLFTDAPAKDENLKSTVIALIEQTQTVVNFIITDIMASARRRRSVDDQTKRITAADAQIYRDLAQVSGGLAVEVTTSELPAVTSLIIESTSTSQVTLLHAARNPGTDDTFCFLVDDTIENLTVYITGRSFSFTVNSPTGDSQLSTDPTSADSLIISSELVGNFQTLRLKNEVGVWKIVIESTNQYSLKVVGRSAIDFFFEFVQPAEGSSTEFDALETRPIAGVSGNLLVSVTGSDSATVSVVTLVALSGTELVSGDAVEQADGSFLVQIDVMPSVEFVVNINGQDDSFPSTSSPVVFQRQSTTTFRTSDVKITADLVPGVLIPGTPLSVPFSVMSTETGGSFTIKASNSRQFDLSFESTLTLEAESSSDSTVTITAPPDTPSGTDVTLTIEVDAPGGADSNYVVLRFTVLTTVTDFTEPECQLLSVQSICSEDCSTSQWEVSVRVTDGPDGTGVARIGIRRGHGTISTSVDPTDENIILVSYTASCCSPEVELLVVDQVGNVGSCVYTVLEPSQITDFSSIPQFIYCLMTIMAIGTYLVTAVNAQ